MRVLPIYKREHRCTVSSVTSAHQYTSHYKTCECSSVNVPKTHLFPPVFPQHAVSLQ